MDISIEERVFAEADFLLLHKGTVRSVAKNFGVSKSTVHFDLSRRLRKLNAGLFEKVDKLLKINLKERHLRGGIATKKKFAAIKKIVNEQ